MNTSKASHVLKKDAMRKPRQPSDILSLLWVNSLKAIFSMFDCLVYQISRLRNKIFSIRYGIGIREILYLYRYMSWFFISLFYLFTQTNEPIVFKIGVVVILFIAAKIITDTYIKFSQSFRILEIAILMETLGITLLLISAGGLKSPYAWYVLNPVLVAASFLPIYFCWINLLFYLISTSLISFAFFREFETVLALIKENAYFILVFMLIALALQMLSHLAKRLNQQTLLLKKQGQELETMNESLQNSNAMYKESIDNIMSLYQIAGTFHLEENLESICSAFAYYASQLTKSDLAFVWKASDGEKKDRTWVYSNIIVDIEEDLATHIANQWKHIRGEDKLIQTTFEGFKCLVMNAKSLSRDYGLIGVLTNIDSQSNELCLKQLSFLSNLLGGVLERQHLKELEDQLLIIEEQNRIANEIHDSVCQRLFSIVCGITAITKKYNSNSKELQSHFELIRKSADLAMSELRSSIYRLSSRKKGEKPFAHMIKEYLENFAQLHFIEISFSIMGEEELVPSQLKRALYRMICQGTGNAVQHGRCRHLWVTLKMGLPNIVLSIEDDGQGFDVNDIKIINSSGLGIRNMRNLVLTFNGDINIDSDKGKNTRITIRIPAPRQYIYNMEESAI